MGIKQRIVKWAGNEMAYREALSKQNKKDRAAGTGSSYDSYSTIAKRHPGISIAHGKKPKRPYQGSW